MDDDADVFGLAGALRGDERGQAFGGAVMPSIGARGNVRRKVEHLGVDGNGDGGQGEDIPVQQ